MKGLNSNGFWQWKTSQKPETAVRCVTEDSFRMHYMVDLTFLILFGAIIGWSILSVYSTAPMGVSIDMNRTTPGEIVKGEVLQQEVPVQSFPHADSVCYDVLFATYSRINYSLLKVSLNQTDYHQSVTLNSAILQDNRMHPLCFPAKGLASGGAILEIAGIDGAQGKSPTVWMTSDLPNGGALKNSQKMGKGLIFRAYVKNYLYRISNYILAFIVLSLILTAIILIKNKTFKIPEGVEFIISAFIVICASFTAAPVIVGMASTSMWNDELYSIAKFSSIGPVHTLTDYHVPNNHIFFNLLNSWLLFPDRYHPLSARLLSYIAVAFSVLFPVGFLIRRKLYFEACFLFFIIMANKFLLDLCLQARGYGFLLLSASACCLLTWRYLESNGIRYAVALAMTVWLATWTVPTFIIFGAPLMIILLILTKEKIWLFVGISCAAAIAIVYSPVYSDMIKNQSTFAGQWGTQFADWNAVSVTIRTYLLFGANDNWHWLSFAFALSLVILMINRKLSSPHLSAIYAIALASAVCLLLAMKMKTPFPRTMAFIAFPLAFVFISLLGSLFSRSTYIYGRMIMISAMAVGVFCATLVINTDRSFTPIEAWMETARAVEQRFPVHTKIYAPFRNNFLAIFLSPERQFADRFDLTSFSKGEMIIVDSSFIKEQNFQLNLLPEKFSTIAIPQRRGGAQRIYFSEGL